MLIPSDVDVSARKNSYVQFMCNDGTDPVASNIDKAFCAVGLRLGDVTRAVALFSSSNA